MFLNVDNYKLKFIFEINKQILDKYNVESRHERSDYFTYFCWFYIEFNHIIEISSIILYQKQISIPIDIEIKDEQIIIKKYQWKKFFHKGNYSISMIIHINITNTIKSIFIRQIWLSKYFINKFIS